MALGGPAEGSSPGQQALVQAAGPPAAPVIRTEVDQAARNERSSPGIADKLMFWRKTPPAGDRGRSGERGEAPARERRTRPEPGDRRHADRPAQEAGLPGGDLLAIAPDQATPHFVQVGAAPAFRGVGPSDLLCRCGASVLIQGYLPAQFPGDPHPVLSLRHGQHDAWPARGRDPARRGDRHRADTDADGHHLRHRPRPCAGLPGRDRARLRTDPPPPSAGRTGAPVARDAGDGRGGL